MFFKQDLERIAHIVSSGYAGYTTIQDSATTGTVYFGYAPCGTATSSPLWRIKKSVTVDNVVTTTYANAGIDNQIWDNRASLIYS